MFVPLIASATDVIGAVGLVAAPVVIGVTAAIAFAQLRTGRNDARVRWAMDWPWRKWPRPRWCSSKLS